jgi:hypothetical protein
MLSLSDPLRQDFFRQVDKMVYEVNVYFKGVSLPFGQQLFSNNDSDSLDVKKSAPDPKNVSLRQPRAKSNKSGNNPAGVSNKVESTAAGSATPEKFFEIVSSADNQIMAAGESGGFIFVQSTPENGRVMIEGQEAGFAPLTIKVYEPGNYEVIVELKYFDPYDIIVRVDESEVTKINARLRTGKGLLTIVSTPQEATVKVDGKVEGKTPLTIKALTAGQHQVYLQKEGKEYSGDVEILPGDSKVMNVVLKKLTTAILVNSEPANAHIYIDGIWFGKTPNKIDNLSAGKYQLILEKSKSLVFVDSILIETEKENVVWGTLVEKKHYKDVFSATLQVFSDMKDVFIRINGVTYGQAPEKIENLRSGEHKILLVKAVRNGAYYYETKLYLRPGEKRVINIPQSEYKFKKIF